ncbi:MAG: transposase, partial [Aquificaceae bacterium]
MGPRKRGAPIIYDDRAIELMLIIKAHYNLPNRQTEGFVRSIFERVGIQLSVPDHTTLSRRGRKLKVELPAKRGESL